MLRRIFERDTSETHAIDNVSIFQTFFSESFKQLYITRLENWCWLNFAMKLWSENTSISRYFHFKNMKWCHIFRKRIKKSDTFISFSQQCSGSLIVPTFQDVSKCSNYSVNFWIYYCLIFLCFRKDITWNI